MKTLPTTSSMTVPNPGVYFMPRTGLPAPLLMTAEEAASYLRLDEGRESRDGVIALERLVTNKRISPTRGIGRHNRFSLNELNRFIEECTRSEAS